MSRSWLEESSQGIVLRLYIQPKASKTEIAGLHGADPADQRLKIRIAAPPVEGEANDELLRFLKRTLKAGSSRFTGQLELLRGSSSRTKDVLCTGLEAAKIRLRLGF